MLKCIRCGRIHLMLVDDTFVKLPPSDMYLRYIIIEKDAVGKWGMCDDCEKFVYKKSQS